MTFPLRSTASLAVAFAVFTAASLLPGFGLPLAGIGVVIAAVGLLTGADWLVERVNHHRHEHARATVDPYTRLAAALSKLSVSMGERVMDTMSIRAEGIPGEFYGDRLPIMVSWRIMLPDNDYIDLKFVQDYLRATAAWQRDDPTVGTSMWAVNWHTRGDRPAVLEEYTDLEGRISRLTAAFVTWGLAERATGPYPAQLRYSVEEIMDAFGV